MQKKTILVAVILLTAITTAFAQTVESDFETDGNYTITKYVGFDEKVVVPSTIRGKTITAIGNDAFNGAGLSEVTIPNTIKRIGKRAFFDNKITNLVIPEGVMFIEEGAFLNNKLISITIPSSVISIGRYNGYDSFRENGWYENFDLKNVTLADNVVCLDKDTFPQSIFWDYILNDRKAGTYTVDVSINYGPSTKQNDDGYEYFIRNNAVAITGFSGNRARIPQTIDGTAVKAIIKTGEMTVVQIPEGITYIGSRAFYDASLTNIVIPNSVTYIGERAFWDNKLTSVIIPDNVTYIGKEAFQRNVITELTLGKNIRYICDGAFEGIGATVIRLPNTLIYIGTHAFDTRTLKNIIVPTSVIYLGQRAFGYYALDSITIGANVELLSDSTDGSNFAEFYNLNGKKAGIYNYVIPKNSSRGQWQYKTN